MSTDEIKQALSKDTPISLSLLLAVATAIGGAAVGNYQAHQAYAKAEGLEPRVTTLEADRLYDREQRARVDKTLDRVEATLVRMADHISRDEATWTTSRK